MNALIIGKGRMAAQIEEVLVSKGHACKGKADLFDGKAQDLVPGADVIIDFSHRDNLDWYLEEAVKQNIPVVIGTTGLTEEHQKKIEEASKSIPVFKSANYSLGIAVLSMLTKQAAAILKGKWDIEIVECHHNQKADAPSGTALLLADAADPQQEYTRVCGRRGMAKRTDHEIGLSSIRGGSVPGDHTVSFFGEQEHIDLSHSAQSRGIFAQGAVEAADFLLNQKPGLYNMEDLTAQSLQA